MRTRQQEITEMLKQTKTNSRTPVGPKTGIRLAIPMNLLYTRTHVCVVVLFLHCICVVVQFLKARNRTNQAFGYLEISVNFSLPPPPHPPPPPPPPTSPQPHSLLCQIFSVSLLSETLCIIIAKSRQTSLFYSSNILRYSHFY